MAVELISRKLQRWVKSTVWPRANDLTVWRQNWGSAVHSEDNIIHQKQPGNTTLLFGCCGKWSDFSPHRIYLENRHVECFYTNIFMRLLNLHHCKESFDTRTSLYTSVRDTPGSSSCSAVFLLKWVYLVFSWGFFFFTQVKEFWGQRKKWIYKNKVEKKSR